MATQAAGKARKRLTRREMKEDKLIGLAQKVEQFYDENRKTVFTVAAAVLVIIIAFFLIQSNRQKSFEQASLDLTISKILFDMGNLDEAEPQLRELQARYGGRIAGEAQYYLARGAFMRGNIEEAEAAFREYIDKYHVDKYLDIASIAGLAVCLESQEKYEEAAEVYLSIPRKHRKHYFAPQAMFQAAKCYLLANQKDKAVQTYQLLQNQYPSSPLKTKASKQVAQLR